MSAKRKRFVIMASPEDLDAIREIFGEMECDEEHVGYLLAKRLMNAARKCAKTHGFTWSNSGEEWQPGPLTPPNP